MDGYFLYDGFWDELRLLIIIIPISRYSAAKSSISSSVPPSYLSCGTDFLPYF